MITGLFTDSGLLRRVWGPILVGRACEYPSIQIADFIRIIKLRTFSRAHSTIA